MTRQQRTAGGPRGRQRPLRAPTIDHWRRIDWLAALAATGIAVWLYVTFVQHAGPLWRDEVNSVNTAASASLADLWRRMEFESTPILSLMLIRAWDDIGAGGTDAGLRIFGLAGGLAVVAAVWFASARLTRTVPTLALALLAVNSGVIRWTASVRAWGLGTALAIVAMVLIRDALARRGWRTLAWAGAAAVLSVQCVYQNVILLAAAITAGVAVALVEGARKTAVGLLAIGVVATLTLAPYLGPLSRRSTWNALNQGPLTMSMIATRMWELLSSGGPIVAAVWVVLVAAAFFVAVVRLPRAARSAQEASAGVTAFAALALAFSSAGLVAFYLASRVNTQPWYYVTLLAVGAVCAETIVVTFARMWPPSRFVRMALTALVLVAGAVPAHRSLVVPPTNVDDLAAQLNGRTLRGDLIIVNPWFLGITFARYYTGPADVVTLPPIEDVSVHRFDLVKRAMIDADPLAPVLARARDVLETGHKIWFVGTLLTRSPGTRSTRTPPAPLPGSGWNQMPYLASWMFEVSDFLGDHVEGGSELPVRLHGWPLEDATLGVFWGWRP